MTDVLSELDLSLGFFVFLAEALDCFEAIFKFISKNNAKSLIPRIHMGTNQKCKKKPPVD